VESENVALVRRVYELFNQLDPDAEVRRGSQAARELLGCFAEDLEYVQVGGPPDADTHRDRDRFYAVCDDWLTTWREHRSEIEAIREEGDRVRDGRVVRLEGYMEQQPAIDDFERS
jgi:ketosteroid isomerase-like protein